MPSGTIYGSFTAKSTSIARPYINWSYTQNTTANTSTVTATLVFVRYDGYRSYNNNTNNFTINIGGQTTTSAQAFDIGPNGQTDTIFTATETITHDADGEKTITISASGSTGLSSLGSVSLSASLTLTTIPRASDFTAFTLSNTVLNKDTAVTMNYTLDRKSTSFSQDMTLKIGSTVIDSWNTTGTGALTRTLSAADVNTILTKVPNSTSGTLTLTMQTKSGTSNIGSAKSINEGFSLNSAIAPTASGLTASIYGTGRDKTLGLYVQNISKVTASFTATAGYGATESSHTIVVRRQSDDANSQTITGENGTTANVVTLSGTYEIIATAKDSRGRTATQTITISVTAYSSPSISNFSTVRSTSVSSTVNASIASSWSPMGTSNPTDVTIVGVNNVGTSQTLYTLNDSTATGLNTTQAYTGQSDASSFTYTLTITDSFGKKATAIATVGTSFVELTIAKGLGIGVGKVHEHGALDVKGIIYADSLYSQDNKTEMLKDYKNGNVTISATGAHLYLGYQNTTLIRLSRDLYDSSGTKLIIDSGGRVRLDGTDDLSLTSTTHAFQIGPSTGQNLAMDANEFCSRNNGAAADLHLNTDGGTVIINNNFGYQGQKALEVNGYVQVIGNGGNMLELWGDDHGYIEFFVKGTSTRTGYIGYPSSTSSILTLYTSNEIRLIPANGAGSGSGFVFDAISNGGIDFGVTKCKFLSTTGTIQARNSADTAYIPMNASAFTVSSKKEFKTNIQLNQESVLDKIRGTKVYDYHLHEELNEYELDDKGKPFVKRIKDLSEVKKRKGLLFEEAPEELLDGEGIDLYAMNSMLWQAVQELSEQVDFLDGKIKNR